MKGKIESIELMKSIEDYVPKEAKITLIVSRETPKEHAEVMQVIKNKETLGGDFDIQIEPAREETH